MKFKDQEDNWVSVPCRFVYLPLLKGDHNVTAGMAGFKAV